MLISVINVDSLAAGATVDVPHGLQEAGNGVKPDSVRPEGSTPIVIVSADEESVTFRNDGSGTESANFVVRRLHSIERATNPRGLDLPLEAPSSFQAAGQPVIYMSPNTSNGIVSVGTNFEIWGENFDGASVLVLPRADNRVTLPPDPWDDSPVDFALQPAAGDYPDIMIVQVPATQSPGNYQPVVTKPGFANTYAPFLISPGGG